MDILILGKILWNRGDVFVCLHHSVDCLNFLGLRTGNSLEVNVLRACNNLTRHQKLPFLTWKEIRQDPWLLLPTLHSSPDKLLVLICGALGFRCGSSLSTTFWLKDHINKITEGFSCFFYIRVEERVERGIIRVTKVLEILNKLLTDLVSVGCLCDLLFLEEFHVNEIVSLI